MPRRRASQTSISSEQSTSSEQSENLTVSEEFPDAGLTNNRGKNSKKKKSVSFNLDGGKNKENTVNLIDDGPSTSTSKENKPEDNQQVLEEKNSSDVATKPKKGGKKDAGDKQPKGQEKRQKQDADNMNRIYKPGECIKHMNIEVHPSIMSEWYMSELRRVASSAGISLVMASDICDASAILWTRNVTRKITGQDGVLKLSPTKQHCSVCLYVVSAGGAAALRAGGALAAHLAAKRELLNARLTLVIVGAPEYFRKSIRRAANGFPQSMSEIDLEVAITDLLVGLKVETILVDSAEELAQLIVQYTKAIAEEPYKKAKREIDEQASFYMRGDNKNCVAVDKDGNGLSRLWQQMLSVLPTSSLEVSRALTAQYSSPRALAQELSSEGGVSRVSELGVVRSRAASARPRRLGTELARRLHTLLTETNGDVIVE